MNDKETWVTPRHGAEIVHCPPSLVEQLMADGVLPARLAPNPHGTQFSPMRLIPLSVLTGWLDSHPPTLVSGGTRHAYTKTSPAIRLRDVSSRLMSLADQRPWVTLLLLLLRWEGSESALVQSESQALPVLWEATVAINEKSLWQGPNAKLVRFDFPSIGYAQFSTAWSPAGTEPASGGLRPFQSEGRFYHRFVGPREPARYPPAILLKDLETALKTFQLRWF